ncbi:response regulator [Salinibius halmophilus]|uniref:response regulator n=1 Tax=Salinibius halmophilus TaxID=1853216 RepID=UPI000E672934|nr:response regulator [Salinibius halmophilus]
MRVLIIDDEPFARDELAFLLSEFARVEVVGFACDGIEAGELIHQKQPDVVFCDIEMPGLNGMELARMFANLPLRWVFVTAYDTHAITAFDLQATDYLVKPVEPERLARCVERLREHFNQHKFVQLCDRLVGKIGQRLLVVNRDSLRYAFSDGINVNLVANETSHSDLSLKALVTQAGLVQCHRQYAVNIDHVREVKYLENGNAELLVGDSTVPVSRRYLRAIKIALGI